MTTHNRGFQGKVLEGGKKREEDTAYFREKINNHLPMIERQCFKAVKQQLTAAGYANPAVNNPVNIENEALELSNLVLDTLQRDDYRVLRQFKGNSKLSTYITTIIARQAVDMVRKKRGRSREKERAQKFGEIGMMVYEKLVVQGCSVPEVFSRLKSEAHISQSLEEIEVIAEKITGKKVDNVPGDSVVKEATSSRDDERAEFVIADTNSDPGELLMESQRKEKVHEAVRIIIDELSGEERLILRMRFPANDDEKPQKVNKIANLLSISEKAAYKRIARVLKKCRSILEREGVTVHELL
jgi:RNA polymerase sigma factor (sigma-70 family)